uniref:Type I cytokine receptor cytokine-binding domain-containing protein n=1 Tax=Leptobrachium leishanense TaxID=445787 RepID=A0A8C5PZK9_9ANUR
MRITKSWHSHIFLAIWISITVTTQSLSLDSQEENLFPPTNITLKMNIFKLHWAWESRNDTCQIKYNVCVATEKSSRTSCRSHKSFLSWHEVKTSIFNLNERIHFKVHAECSDGKRKSEEAKLSTFLLSGDPNTAVTNFRCVWYNKEYIKCTWLPGKSASPNVNYTVLYWQENENSKMELKVPHPALFHEFLNTAKFCRPYLYKDGIPEGCLFEISNIVEELQFVVADLSNKSITPFYSWMIPVKMLQLAPPVITNISKIDQYTIYARWNVSGRKMDHVETEINLTTLNTGKSIIASVKGQNWMELKANHNEPYTINVRSRIYHYDSNHPWSEWSANMTGSGESGYWTTNVILAILIPAAVTLLMVFSIVCMKRLHSYIFPPIPDPRKSFGGTNNLRVNILQYLQHAY